MRFTNPKQQRLFYNVCFPLLLCGRSPQEIKAIIDSEGVDEMPTVVSDYITKVTLLDQEQLADSEERFNFISGVLQPMVDMYFDAEDIAIVRATVKGENYEAFIDSLAEMYVEFVEVM